MKNSATSEEASIRFRDASSTGSKEDCRPSDEVHRSEFDARARHVKARTVARDRRAGERHVMAVAGRAGGSGTVISIGVRFWIEADIVCSADDDFDPNRPKLGGAQVSPCLPTDFGRRGYRTAAPSPPKPSAEHPGILRQNIVFRPQARTPRPPGFNPTVRYASTKTVSLCTCGWRSGRDSAGTSSSQAFTPGPSSCSVKTRPLSNWTPSL
jgi:hypothetical protein